MNNDAIERRWELARRCFAAWLAILLLWGSNFVIIFSIGMRGFAGSAYGPLLDFGFIVLCTLPQAMAVGLLLFNFPRKSPFKPLAYLMLLQGALFLWGSYGYWNVSEVRNFYAVLAIASLFTAFICFRSEQGSKWLSVSKLWLIPLLTFAVLLIMATLREVSIARRWKLVAAKELKEQRKAFEEFRAAAAGGDADAQREMGRCYASGGVVPKDMVEAGKWYRKAAEQGDPEAQKNLGYCYASGEGVAKDHGEAVKWYRKAAQQGDREARKIADDLQKKIEAKPAEKKPGE